MASQQKMKSTDLNGLCVNTGEIRYKWFPYGKKNEKNFDSIDVNVGQIVIPRKKLEGTVVDITAELFPTFGKGFWEYKEETHDKKFASFLKENPELKQKLLAKNAVFTAPTDGAKQRKNDYKKIDRYGKRIKYDVPNLVFSIVCWLLRNRPDVKFIDPLDFFQKKENIKVTDLTMVMTFFKLLKKEKGVQDVVVEEDGVGHIMFQRNNGNMTPNERRLLEKRVLNFHPHAVHLSVPKYDRNGNIDQRCYNEINESVARLGYNLFLLPEFTKLNGTNGIQSLNIVLDEFSGYALSMAAIVYGLGYEKFTNIMCYYRGDYVTMPAQVSDSEDSAEQIVKFLGDLHLGENDGNAFEAAKLC